MKQSHFSEEVLSTTLAAVRSRRRRQNYTRSATLLGLATAIALVWHWPPPKKIVATLVDSPPPNDSHLPEPAIKIFTTADLAPKVNYLDDDGLATMMRGRSYGTYVAADGNRKLWLPGS